MDRRKLLGGIFALPGLLSLGKLTAMSGGVRYASPETLKKINDGLVWLNPGVYTKTNFWARVGDENETIQFDVYKRMHAHMELAISKQRLETFEDGTIESGGYYYSNQHLRDALAEYLKAYNISVEFGYTSNMNLKLLQLTKGGEDFPFDSDDMRINPLLGLFMIIRLGNEIIKSPEKYFYTDGVIKISMLKLFLRRNRDQVSSALMMTATPGSVTNYREPTWADPQ